MTAKFCGLDHIVDLALSYVEGTISDLPMDTRQELTKLFSAYLHEEISFEYCRERLLSLIGRDDALVRIREIMIQPTEPLPYHEDHDSDDCQMSLRKKTRTWAAIEDQRLYAAVDRFGIDNWQTVANFLGNGRNRAQCSQRWTRCLNPKISKKSWNQEDDKQLKELVNLYGDKSWTKIASIMGNRSDVQCRYHYKQLINGGDEETSGTESSSVPLQKTFSSENFNLNPSSLPSNIKPDYTQTFLNRQLTSRNFSSTPNLISSFNTLAVPLAPITMRKTERIIQTSAPEIAPFEKKKLNWGVTGADEQSLNSFLSNFSH